MSGSTVARPLARRLLSPPAIRAFSLTHARPNAEATPESAPTTADPNLDPNTVLGWKAEQALAKAGTPPIGSRRRRAAIRAAPNIPFEQLPYQCFQEALSVIRADREEKVAAIRTELAKIARLEGIQEKEGAGRRKLRIASLKKYVEELKVLADINDPLVKKRFEDGLGELIYLFLLPSITSFSYNHLSRNDS